jgi:recombination protein RecR
MRPSGVNASAVGAVTEATRASAKSAGSAIVAALSALSRLARTAMAASSRTRGVCVRLATREVLADSAGRQTLKSDHSRQNGQVFSPAVENLVAQLTRLPGVGTRTAQRLAFHLLRVPKDEALALAAALAEVKERVRFCAECGNLTEEETCEICRDARRDRTVICVVEQPADLISVERTHEYRGLYHVLGGALSPLDGVEPGDLRIADLLGRVERNGVEEVVLATNPNMTGEATASYLADRLRGRVRVTRLASGLPVGGDLEYADEVTLGRALAGRREMS